MKLLSVILIFLFLLFAFALFPFLSSLKSKIPAAKFDPLLFKKVNRFNSYLAKANGKGIYALFNPTFQAEIPEERFVSAFNDWLKRKKTLDAAGKKSYKVETKFIYITGLTASVSTWLWRDKTNYHYLFASWIKTDNGWQILWLSPVLNGDFDYGRGEIPLRRELLGLAVKKALADDGFAQEFRGFEQPKTLVFLRKGRPEEKIALREIPIPLRWLTLEEIKKNPPPFYLDFGAIRIIGNIATVYLDLIPTKNGEGLSLSRSRGLQFQFKKDEEGLWEFVSYGSKW